MSFCRHIYILWTEAAALISPRVWVVQRRCFAQRFFTIWSIFRKKQNQIILYGSKVTAFPPSFRLKNAWIQKQKWIESGNLGILLWVFETQNKRAPLHTGLQYMHKKLKIIFVGPKKDSKEALWISKKILSSCLKKYVNLNFLHSWMNIGWKILILCRKSVWYVLK